MIITDGIHLVSTISLEELHEFARKIDLKAAWFQDQKLKHPHYDITTARKLKKALDCGASMVTSRELVKRMFRG